MSPLFLLALCSAAAGVANGCPGLVPLDQLTLDKILAKFRIALLLIDNQAQWGDAAKRQVACDLASRFLLNQPQVLVAELRLVWGATQDKLLAERFRLSDNRALPEFILFRDGIEVTRYGGQVSVEKMLHFVEAFLQP